MSKLIIFIFQVPQEEVLPYFEPLEITSKELYITVKVDYMANEFKNNPMFCQYHSAYLDDIEHNLTVTMDYVRISTLKYRLIIWCKYLSL